MPNILLPILPGQWPQGYCPPDYQSLLVTLANNMQAVLNGATFYNYGSTKPDPSLQQYPWLYSPQMRWYYFDGNWVSPNPILGNSGAVWWFNGMESDIWSFDGGDGTDPSVNPPGNRSGAMWQRLSAMDGRVPVGPGTVPTSDPAATIGQGATSDSLGAQGEYAHTLTQAEGPAHVHPAPKSSPAQFFACQQLGGTTSYEVGAGDSISTAEPVTGFNTPAGQPHANMQPYYGLFAIVRTARVNYLIP